MIYFFIAPQARTNNKLFLNVELGRISFPFPLVLIHTCSPFLAQLVNRVNTSAGLFRQKTCGRRCQHLLLMKR
jgi:hypothetical protein